MVLSYAQRVDCPDWVLAKENCSAEILIFAAVRLTWTVPAQADIADASFAAGKYKWFRWTDLFH